MKSEPTTNAGEADSQQGEERECEVGPAIFGDGPQRAGGDAQPKRDQERDAAQGEGDGERGTDDIEDGKILVFDAGAEVAYAGAAEVVQVSRARVIETLAGGEIFEGGIGWRGNRGRIFGRGP